MYEYGLVGCNCNSVTSVHNTVTSVCNTVTSVCNTVTSGCSSQCRRYFAVASKECYAPGLRTIVTSVDEQECCKFSWNGTMLQEDVTIAVS